MSVFLARAARSAEVAWELPGAGFAGILISDRYAAYHWVDPLRWQVCRAYLLQDFTKMAERTIRSYVMWRKSGFGTQSKRGSLYMERVMTTIGGCKLQGRNILHFIMQAGLAHAGLGAMPSSVRCAAA